MISSDAAMAVTLFGAVASIAWSATIAWGYWLKHRFDEPTGRRSAAVTDDRISRLEAAIDGLALEMERLGEAQRFTAKLLHERLPLQPSSNPLPSVAAGRVVTPH
jgi:hypothetical protein